MESDRRGRVDLLVTDDGTGTVHAVWAVRGLPTKSAGRIWHAKIRWQAPS